MASLDKHFKLLPVSPIDFFKGDRNKRLISAFRPNNIITFEYHFISKPNILGNRRKTDRPFGKHRMAHHVLEPDFIGSAREVLKKALDCLDKIGLHGAAAHIDMARCAFETHVANVSEYAALPISAHDEAHVEFERLLDAYDAPIGMARG